MSLMGVDVGTTGCKAAVFSEGGECLASAYREYAPSYPRPGWVELDARKVMECVRACIAEVAAASRADPVSALSVSSMGEAAVPVTRERQILGPSILSSDTRGGELLAPITSAMSPLEFYQINPNFIGPMYTLPKLLWLRENDSQTYARADKFLLWSDMVGFMLGCEPVVSYALANRTLLFDIRRQDWSDRLLELSGVERGKLPRCVPSGTVVGTVSAQAAGELGLPAGVKVVVGSHDQCCNSLGAGITRAGRAVCGIGTYECITPTYDRIPPAEGLFAQGLNVEHHALPGLYVSFLYNQGGALVRWFRDTFAAGDKRRPRPGEDLYAALSAEMPPEPTALYTLPYFEITGPPEYVADAAGAIVGLKMATTRGEVLKSIMECVTFYFVDMVQALRKMGLEASEFVATGGGAKSDQWLQIKADIFGVPLVRPKITEGSLLGAAILAGASTGAFASPEEAVSLLVKRDRVFTPDPRRHELYQQRLAKYRQLFPLLREFLRGLR